MGVYGSWEAVILVTGRKYGLFIDSYINFFERTKVIVVGLNTLLCDSCYCVLKEFSLFTTTVILCFSASFCYNSTPSKDFYLHFRPDFGYRELYRSTVLRHFRSVLSNMIIFK